MVFLNFRPFYPSMSFNKIQSTFMNLSQKEELLRITVDNLFNVFPKLVPIVSNIFRVFIFIEECEKISKEKKEKKNNTKNDDFIQFKNVDFKTPNGKSLCEVLNFKVNIGENLLIMGPSGITN
jgi:ABC-type uncharacterized transport system fused permease/ATPase subunit